MRFRLLLVSFLQLVKLAMPQSSERMTRSEYFDTYHEMAVHEMLRSGVPASITLAQGALESGDGNSSLAREANNHFGIKCHEDWNGKSIYQDDDSRNECFRKYKTVEESFRDHSDYLKAKSRYAFLFDLNITDYKGWARGLKKAGYATSPSYAEALIRIIEEFDLKKYDRMDGTVQIHQKRQGRANGTAALRTVMERNRVKYVLAVPGDTYESLTREFGKLDWEIPGYNDASPGDSLVPGEVVYIQPKRNKAEAGKNVHILKEDESLYTISQLYAIKLSRLCAMNLLDPGARPEPGTPLQLIKALRRPAPKPVILDAPQGGEEKEEIKVELNLD